MLILCQLMLKLKKKLKKKNVFYRTDTRTTQNYSSEPHNMACFLNYQTLFFFV